MIYYKAAAAKAEEQAPWSGSDQLGYDSYAANIIAAALGNRVLYEHDGKDHTGYDLKGTINHVLYWGMVRVYPEPVPEVKPARRWCFTHDEPSDREKDGIEVCFYYIPETGCDVSDGDMVRR